ncbi:hypothetical protein ACFSEO_04475 [Agromyces cerinus subsp. nitratus]
MRVRELLQRDDRDTESDEDDERDALLPPPQAAARSERIGT